MQKSTMFKGYLYSILSAVIYGCMPLMSKHIYAGGVNSISLVFFRNLFAIPLVALLAFRQSKSFAIPKKALPEITVIAIIGCCITPLLLLSSYNFMASSVATVFHFIYPAVVVLIGIIFMKQKANIKTIFCVLLCVFGLCLFYTPGEPIDIRGVLLAIISGITCAVYICFLSVFKYKEIPLFLFTFYVIVISSITLFFFCIFTNTLTFPTNAFGWFMCILFANLITAGAVVLLQAGTFIIGGERSSILSTLEPITSIILGLLFLNEGITLVTACGAILVILASVLIAIFDAKKS